MAFHLQIVTPDRMCFDGEAQRVICRTVDGDICIMAHHIDYAAALGIGECKVVDADGKARSAACSGGLLGVADGAVRLLPTTFEWQDEIDLQRAEKSKETVETRMKGLEESDAEYAHL